MSSGGCKARPQNILNRFMVKSISLNKHSETTSQHEFLTIEVYDAKLLNAKTHLVFLERTATSEVLPETTTIDGDFANHPDAHLIRDIIQKVLNSLSSSSSHPFNASKSDLTIPLIPITTPSQSSNSLPLTQLSLADATSLASTQAFVHKLSDSFLAKTRQAGDHFVVRRQPSPSYGRGRVVRQFNPKGLTFSQLVTLANIVHNHHPLYSLLKRQCYWFANIVYLVAIEEESSKCTIADIPNESGELDI